MKNIRHLLRGKHGEALAAKHLQRHNVRILARNIRIGGGEIDLIGEENGVLLFIEVRLRKSGAQVSAAESITPAKRKKWHNAAAAYLQKHYKQPPDCRFDAVCISDQDGKTQIDWLRGVDV